TDFEQTPVARVFEFVKREAARYGVLPLSSEIVGLIPKKALEEAAEWFLQVENFDSSMILENRLAAVMSGKVAVVGLRGGAVAVCGREQSRLSNSWRRLRQRPGAEARRLRRAPWLQPWAAWWQGCHVAKKPMCNTSSS